MQSCRSQSRCYLRFFHPCTLWIHLQHEQLDVSSHRPSSISHSFWLSSARSELAQIWQFMPAPILYIFLCHPLQLTDWRWAVPNRSPLNPLPNRFSLPFTSLCPSIRTIHPGYPFRRPLPSLSSSEPFALAERNPALYLDVRYFATCFVPSLLRSVF